MQILEPDVFLYLLLSQTLHDIEEVEIVPVVPGLQRQLDSADVPVFKVTVFAGHELHDEFPFLSL